MNIWKDVVITEKGLALQNKINGRECIKIYKGRSWSRNDGSRKISHIKQVLRTFRQNISFQTGKAADNGIEIQILLDNIGLKTAYSLHQIGIYARDPEEGEILYCIAQTSEGKMIPADQENPGFSITWKIFVSEFWKFFGKIGNELCRIGVNGNISGIKGAGRTVKS